MDGSEKMKTGLECFQNLKIEMQWQYSNFIQLKGPTALSCHVMSCHVMLVPPTALLPFSDFLFFLFSFFLLHRASTDHSNLVSSSSPPNLHCYSTNHQLPLPQATTTNLSVQAQPRKGLKS